MKKSNICCIIVTYNIGERFGNCFYSIKNQVDKVVIVDNGSEKDTVEYINKLNSIYDIELILNKENMGIAYALNQGVRYALKNNYDWILTMDNDSEATPNMLDTMIGTYNSLVSNKKEKIVGLFPAYLEKGLNCEVIKNPFSRNETFYYVNSEITSGNLLKKEVFYNVGLYNEDLFIDYVDHEFCYRIIEKGYKLLKIENAKLLHSLGNTKKKKFLWREVTYTNHSSLRKYYMTRNRFYTWREFKQLNKIHRVDKVNFIKENLKILLFENDKMEKFKMIYKGYRDYRENIYGKYRDSW